MLLGVSTPAFSY